MSPEPIGEATSPLVSASAAGHLPILRDAQATITVQDLTTEGTYTEVELERMVWALRYQALYHYNRSPWVEKGYATACADVKLIARGEKPPAGTWHVELLDTSDQEGALGYHEGEAFKRDTPGTKPEKASGHSSRGRRADNPAVPLAKIFVKTSKEDGVQPSEVASHEILEMLVDPSVMQESTIRKYLDPESKQFYIGEVCDAVQERGYDVGVPEHRPCGFPETIMADFCYPGWWAQEQTRASTTFGEDAAIAPRVEAFELAPGGYMSVAPESDPSAWTQIFGAKAG